VTDEIAQVVPAAPVADGLAVKVVDPLLDRRWDSFVAGDARASVYHLAAWRGILGEAYRFTPAHLALEDRDGRLRGILPLEYKAGPVFGRRITSLPIVGQGGPLAETHALETALVEAACGLSDEKGAVLRVHSPSAGYGGLLRAVDSVATLPTWVAPVPDDVSEPPGRGKRRANLARYIRKAQAAGLTAREANTEEDLRAFYAIYLRTTKRHRALPHSLRLFEELRRTFTPTGAFQLVLIERSGHAVAGAVNLVWRDIVEALFFGLDDRYLELRPSHALYWEVLRLARAKGLRRVNFGPARPGSSQAAFKAQWGAEPMSGFQLVYPAGPASSPRAHHANRIWDRRLASTVWSRTPIPLMGLAGGLMYRYL
jgi:hypothetical protein